MAKKEVSVIIKAKNAMAAGLSAAGASLKNFGQSAARIGKMFAKAFLVAGGALVAFGVKAVSMQAMQESSVASLASALRAYGEEVDNNIAKLKKIAAVMQDETGVGDEVTLSRMARLKILGVETHMLEAAAKGVIALGKAGMEESAALKAVQAATEGEFGVLSRYLPKLKTTNDETEKAAIVNDFMTRAYESTKDELDTVGGAWIALKARMGDALESVGAAIVQNDALTNVLTGLADKVKSVGDAISAWVEGGGVSRWIDTFKLFSSNVKASFEQFGAYAKFGVSNAWASIEWFGKASKTTMENIAIVSKNVWNRLELQAAATMMNIKQIFDRKPGRIKVKWDNLTDGIKQIPEKSADAAAELDKTLAKIASEQASRDKAVLDNAIQSIDKKKNAAVDAANAEIDANKKLTIAKVSQAKLDAINAKKQKAANNAAIQQINQQVQAMEKRKAALAAVAEKGIGQIIEENKAEEERMDQAERDVAKAGQLTASQKRGTKLSKEQKEWLDAFNEIQQAQKNLVKANIGLNDAQKQLQALNDQNMKLDNIANGIKDQRADLKELLQRG